ncbi:aminodeoxychorismate/anthranilate synthase component II [Candidatus Peregrinibacteria bacterium]|nr:aminodeoxychorismate/anthranilate synthase component II [Candidatus Peregrinibacteria bacterium]
MKVLLLDNYDSFTYNLAQMLKECGLKNFDIIKNDKIQIMDIKRYDKILLSPGPGMPKDAGKMMAIIKNFHKTKSIFGVCLGHEAICEFFGGKLINLKEIFHGVASEITITDIDEPLFKGLPKSINGGRYHSWAADRITIPAELNVTAETKDTNRTIMAVSHTKYDVKGVQFHPESFMTPYGKKIIENWLS